jgi:putative nucleotidyltransferase with HDIG domain
MDRIPAVPELYTQVLAELAQPDTSIHFVGQLVARDPAMTAKLLQIVNASSFGLAARVSDPLEALLHLGIERTKSMILLAGVFLPFEKDSCPGFSHSDLWHHSIAVGSFARALVLAETKDTGQAEMAYTAGLLHDIGILLLAANLPKAYAQVLQQARRRKIDLRKVEWEFFQTSHAEVGSVLMNSWGLPEQVLEAIAWHYCPEQSEDSQFSVLTAVHVANAVEREKSLYRSGKLVNQMQASYIERLGLRERQSSWRQLCGLPLTAVPEELENPSRPPPLQ